MNKTFGVIGGDRRLVELGRLLEERGCCVYSYGAGREETEEALQRAASADVVVLPLPLCNQEGLLNGTSLSTAELFSQMSPEQILLAGGVKETQRQEADRYGLHLVDYFQEELKVANAAATADAALLVAMEQLDRSLLGSNCLVLGFGRIGKFLCNRLDGLGAQVTAAARKPEDRAWIRGYGYQAREIGALSGTLDTVDVLFNTVPALLLDETLLAQLPKSCLLVDLASVPGMDQTAVERLGLRSVWARALPGRLVPQTAAEAIAQVLHRILEEGGDPS